MNWENLIFGLGGVFVGALLTHFFNRKFLKFNLLKKSQFKLYESLWSSLTKLEIRGEDLWQKANNENLISFSNALKELKQSGEESRLILDEDDYIGLKGIIERFANYEFNKKRLIDIRRSDNISSNLIQQIISSNRKDKNTYVHLMEEILKKFRSKIA